MVFADAFYVLYQHMGDREIADITAGSHHSVSSNGGNSHKQGNKNCMYPTILYTVFLHRLLSKGV
jgi:hypothetical protein